MFNYYYDKRNYLSKLILVESENISLDRGQRYYNFLIKIASPYFFVDFLSIRLVSIITVLYSSVTASSPSNLSIRSFAARIPISSPCWLIVVKLGIKCLERIPSVKPIIAMSSGTFLPCLSRTLAAVTANNSFTAKTASISLFSKKSEISASQLSISSILRISSSFSGIS